MSCVIVEFGDSKLPRKSEKQKLAEAKAKARENFVDLTLAIGVDLNA